MVMQFKYKIIKRPDGTSVKTPSIPISLKGESQTTFEVIALIDSGADISVIPKDFAELLGLNLNTEKTKAFGIGGEVESVENKISLAISKGHEKYEFQIPVKIILGEYDFPVILGREEFFDKFVVTFYQNKQKISLKKVFEIY